MSLFRDIEAFIERREKIGHSVNLEAEQRVLTLLDNFANDPEYYKPYIDKLRHRLIKATMK